MACNLTTELASDRTTAACYKDYLTGNVSHDLVQIDTDWFPSEQILDLYISELGNIHFSVD